MTGTNERGALAPFRVLELGSTISAPFCGRLLADFGADVVKVEDVAGDTLRDLGENFHAKSLYAASLFRNKATVAIDMRETTGRAVVRRMAATADVLIENFRPGLMEKWGLGYEDLSSANPGLVMVRISGFGQSGPYASRAGYGVIGEAVSGLRYINGDPDRPPGRMATALTDYITGLYGAFGALVALLHRQLSGHGQCVDAALSECAFSFMEPYVQYYDKLGLVAERAGSRLPGATPNNLYATQDGAFILIAAFADPIFRRLCGAMGDPDLAEDPRFATLAARNARVAETDEIVARWTASLDCAEIDRRLREADVPASRIFSMKDIFADPHYAARGMLVPAPDEDIGPVTMAAPVPRLSETPGRIRHAGRRLGQDTREALRRFGKFSDEEIATLIASGAVRADEARTGSEE
jgi:crotonobetainyl-CoA:carnitine CoA-transferase CaiB-like acyl-CoA transferase